MMTFRRFRNAAFIAAIELPVKRGFGHVLCLTLTPTKCEDYITPEVVDFELKY